jgi:hypothetical protein
MLFRIFGVSALVVGLASLTGCSGGGSGIGSANIAASCSGEGVNAVCLVQCSLGCTATACEITEIAQNENIVLVFSDDIDARTVNSSTIQLRTASGSVPVGEFLVRGAVVEFKPSLLEIGGQTFFGFQAGETYTMTMPGGQDEINTIRSTAGHPLGKTLACTLNVSRGIVDLNGVPPAADLVAPSVTSNVAQDAVIRLEFNEIVDPAPFQGQSGTSAPVQFIVRRTIEQNGVRVCSPTQPVPLGGSARLDIDAGRGISILTFTPSSLLPGNACVEVAVTNSVRDLSGRSAAPQVFRFITVPTASVEQQLVENFDDDLNLNREQSAGDWANGRAVFGQIGGDGRHGPFSLGLASRALGTINGVTTYEFDTDNTLIPGEQTLSGSSVAVTDGKFFFSEMVVPADARLLFTGSHPPQFTVRGRLQIDGEIEIAGESVPYVETWTVNVNTGQSGGAGGIFAGDGGKGGDRCLGQGATLNMNGSNGGDCRVLLNHAYAGQVQNTGGRGSRIFPTSGLDADVVAGYPTMTTPAYSMLAAAGGGGGGLFQAGGQGRVVSNPVPDPISGVAPRLDFMGPPAAGGLSMNLLPIPAGAKSSIHFLVGGSGGGGGATHTAFNINFVAQRWTPGCAGGGGGGAIALRAGDQLRISANAAILANGGSAGISPSSTAATARSAPGGGGSGGSVVLQSGRNADIQGTVDVRGGVRGRVARTSPPTTNPAFGGFLETEGGSGSKGFLRLELPTEPSPGAMPGALPVASAENVGQLVEQDATSGFVSTFYSTDQAFGPEFVRYEITAIVGGQTVVYSDDPNVGLPAQPGTAPIRAYWQGGSMDLVTGQVDLARLGSWRASVGPFVPGNSLAVDGLNAFRFLIVIDNGLGVQVEIDSVKVVFRV